MPTREATGRRWKLAMAAGFVVAVVGVIVGIAVWHDAGLVLTIGGVGVLLIAAIGAWVTSG